MTSIDGKIVMSLTRGPNWPFRSLDIDRTLVSHLLFLLSSNIIQNSFKEIISISYNLNWDWFPSWVLIFWRPVIHCWGIVKQQRWIRPVPLLSIFLLQVLWPLWSSKWLLFLHLYFISLHVSVDISIFKLAILKSPAQDQTCRCWKRKGLCDTKIGERRLPIFENQPPPHLSSPAHQLTKHGKTITRLAADNFNDFGGLVLTTNPFSRQWCVFDVWSELQKISSANKIAASETFSKKYKALFACFCTVHDKCNAKNNLIDCTRLITNDSQSIIFKIDVSRIAFLNTHHTPWYRKLALNQKDRSGVTR